VIDQIDIALAPINVHLATFSPSLRLSAIRHAPIVITARASVHLSSGFAPFSCGFFTFSRSHSRSISGEQETLHVCAAA
jgi:hypothetical protein